MTFFFGISYDDAFTHEIRTVTTIFTVLAAFLFFCSNVNLLLFLVGRYEIIGVNQTKAHIFEVCERRQPDLLLHHVNI